MNAKCKLTGRISKVIGFDREYGMLTLAGYSSINVNNVFIEVESVWVDSTKLKILTNHLGEVIGVNRI